MFEKTLIIFNLKQGEIFMNDFLITTEKTCDLPINYLDKNNIKTISMRYTVNDKEYDDINGLTSKEFCDCIRNGSDVKTSAINMFDAEMFFKNLLKEGKNILHIAFSSGLSSSVKNLEIVAKNLNKENDNKIYVLDSFSGSLGQGLLCQLAINKLKEGVKFDELIEYLEGIKSKICHIFTVDNLKYLQKSGRISKAKQTIGSMLQIKPILFLDDEGKIIQYKNVISRKKAIMTICEEFTKSFSNKCNQIYIGHADCMEDAILLQSLIKKKTGLDSEILDICRVIVTHGGPGSLALFYVGNKREF